MKIAPSLTVLVALALAPAASSQDMVAVDWTGTLYVLDGGSGCVSQTLTVNTLNEINAMARRPADGALFVAGVWSVGVQVVLTELDPTTGAAVGTVPLAFADSVRGLAFSPTGQLYLVEDNGFAVPDDLWKVDETTGAGTLVGPIGAYYGVQALTWDPAGSQLFAWDVGSGACIGAGLLTVDPNTGAAVDVDPLCGISGNCWDVQGLTVDASGQLWGVGEYLTRIDSGTGCISWWGGCFLNYLRGVEPWATFSLQSTGNCPTAAQVSILGGTPGGLVAVAYATGLSGTTVPSGGCAGTGIDLGPNPQLAAIVPLDAAGAATVGPRPVPAAACGALWVQAVELVSCRVTNPTQL